VGTARKKHEIEIDGRSVALTNLDKVLYPSGFTKGQVIDFYIRMADYVLPHLAGRPITLKRFPDGVNAPHFYEKAAPRYTPDWVRTFDVPRRNGGHPLHCHRRPSTSPPHRQPRLPVPPQGASSTARPRSPRPRPGEATDVSPARVAFWLKESSTRRPAILREVSG
jgi:hypothetical protein